MTEKISVIIPVYNVENQLQTCLDSVLSQTYQNLEIILINYGSTDNSDAICRSYAARDSRILYFKKDNGGLSDARHIGIRQAKGTYVTYVDAEDWVEPTYLEELYKALQAQPWFMPWKNAWLLLLVMVSLWRNTWSPTVRC